MDIKSGYKQTEVGVIPEDWDVKRLGELVDQRRKITYGIVVPGPETVNGVPLIRAQDYSKGWVSIDDLYRVSHKIDETYKRSRVRTGDVLLTIVGSVGNVASVPQLFNGSNITQQTARLSFNNEVANATYYHNLLLSDVGKRTINNFTKSGVQPSLNLSDVDKFMLPHPPLPEQKAIAQALSDTDALLSGLDDLITKKRDIKQATMQQLLTGKTRLPGFTGEWEVKRLGDVADIDPDNLRSETRADYHFNYVSLEDVDHGRLRSHTALTFGLAPSRARRIIQDQDILVSTVRPNLQSHLLFHGLTGSWVCSTGFCVLRCFKEIADSGYIYAHLFGRHITLQVDALLTGSNYPAINSKDVRTLQVPLPPLPEQQAIATVLSDIDAELEALEQRREKTRELKQAMMQELLTGRTRLV